MTNPPQPERFEQAPGPDDTGEEHPTANRAHAEPADQQVPETAPGTTGPGSDLDHDEGADALETEQQARESKPTRDDQADEEIISLDTPD